MSDYHVRKILAERLEAVERSINDLTDRIQEQEGLIAAKRKTKANLEWERDELEAHLGAMQGVLVNGN